MSIARVKASSLTQGLPKRKTILAGNSAILPGSYESIQTVDVGAGGSASVSFTSIPSTYKHLQIRAIARGTYATGTDAILFKMQVNSDTAANYSTHFLQGYGGVATNIGAGGGGGSDYIRLGGLPKDNWTASVFGPIVIDVLDYANTNKYKTVRCLSGSDGNSTTVYQYVEFTSGLWRNTNAISSISIFPSTGNISQYSSFSLYGIK